MPCRLMSLPDAGADTVTRLDARSDGVDVVGFIVGTGRLARERAGRFLLGVLRPGVRFTGRSEVDVILGGEGHTALIASHFERGGIKVTAGADDHAVGTGQTAAGDGLSR